MGFPRGPLRLACPKMPPRDLPGERSHQGIPVSPGIAHGRILGLGRRGVDIPQRTLDEGEIPSELGRFHEALAATRRDLEGVQTRVAAAMGATEAGLFDAHLLVLEDPTLLAEVTRHVRQDRQNVESVVYHVAERYACALAAVEDEYLRERAADVRDVAARIVDHLLGIHGDRDLGALREPSLVVAHDLPPSTAALMDRHMVLGFVTEVGGQTSHTAILARKLRIPAIVGIADITNRVRTGESGLLDGHAGLLVVNPSDQTLFEYGQLSRRRVALEEHTASGADAEATVANLSGLSGLGPGKPAPFALVEHHEIVARALVFVEKHGAVVGCWFLFVGAGFWSSF